MNRTVNAIVSIAAIALTLASCKPASTPEAAAGEFLAAFAALDFDAASALVTDEGKSNMAIVETFTAGLSAAEREKTKTEFTATITSVEIDGDRATVHYTIPATTEPQTLEMLKIDGKWLADYKKSA